MKQKQLKMPFDMEIRVMRRIVRALYHLPPERRVAVLSYVREQVEREGVSEAPAESPSQGASA